MVGLEAEADRRPAQLSGGMQQRVGLARALATEADLMLMDEAFSALDPLIRREMQDQLLELQRRLGKTIVFITHDLNEAMRLGDRVAVMRAGRIVRTGTPEEILADPRDQYVERFLADVDRTRVFTAADVMTGSPAVVRDGVSRLEALALLEQRGADALLVVDDTGRFTGVLPGADVRAASGGLAGLVRPTAARVPCETPVADLLGPVSTSETPVVVVDSAGRPCGVVTARAVLAALSGGAREDLAAGAAHPADEDGDRPELAGAVR
jgi:glycine betaine/proline transport system ATP-binding protein